MKDEKIIVEVLNENKNKVFLRFKTSFIKALEKAHELQKERFEKENKIMVQSNSKMCEELIKHSQISFDNKSIVFDREWFYNNVEKLNEAKIDKNGD